MQIYTTNALPGLPEVGELMESLTQYFNNVGVSIDLQVIDRSQMVPTIRNRRHTRGIIPARWGSPTPGSVVSAFKNNVDWRQEWQMWDPVYEHINILEAATNWDQLRGSGGRGSELGKTESSDASDVLAGWAGNVQPRDGGIIRVASHSHGTDETSRVHGASVQVVSRELRKQIGSRP